MAEAVLLVPKANFVVKEDNNSSKSSNTNHRNNIKTHPLSMSISTKISHLFRNQSNQINLPPSKKLPRHLGLRKNNPREQSSQKLLIQLNISKVVLHHPEVSRERLHLLIPILIAWTSTMISPPIVHQLKEPQHFRVHHHLPPQSFPQQGIQLRQLQQQITFALVLLPKVFMIVFFTPMQLLQLCRKAVLLLCQGVLLSAHFSVLRPFMEILKGIGLSRRLKRLVTLWNRSIRRLVRVQLLLRGRLGTNGRRGR